MQVERWGLAPLRHHTFFSLPDLNDAITVQLEILNNRPFEKLDGTRKNLFETLDKPALKPLPLHRFTYAQWSRAKVNIDYHIEVDHHYYSVPYQLIHERLDVRLTDTTVEVLDTERRDLLEVIEDRNGSGSTLITSQLPIENWHDHIGDPTIADAILDRLIHNAHRIQLKGGSMRKKQKLDER